MNTIEQKLYNAFIEMTGKAPEILEFAPGRVNLIGEHIDYNGGRVMPCSLSIGTYAAASKRKDSVIRLSSVDIEGSEVVCGYSELEALPSSPSSFFGFGWAAYPLGVAKKLIERGFTLGGFEMTVGGNLPRGSGLSSSASLEILTCAVLRDLFGLTLDGVTASLVALGAERDCAGVNCGIMDQFVCANGRKNAALMLDTNTLEYGYFPFDLGENLLLIMNTNKPRRLADSKYNERRSECEAALELIGPRFSPQKKSLCELTPEEFDGVSDLLPEPLVRRARHAVYENARVAEAAKALEQGNAALLGRLLDASHDSLRDDYEVTGHELDSIVNAARKQEGVLGARMTGAGFGGCAIALVKREFAEKAEAGIADIYRAETGYDCDIYAVETGDSPFGKEIDK